MLQDNYNQNNPLFKGVILKSFQEILDENNKSHYEACIEMPVKAHRCPHCGKFTTYIKDYRIQKAKDLNLLEKPLYLIIRKRRYVCQECNSTFTENNPLINRYKHFSARFYLNSIKECFQLQPFTAIATRLGVSTTSIIRWFDYVSYPYPPLPECFSIDEFKGNAGGERFQCNLADPITHRVIDILPSRDTDEIKHYFLQYKKEDREKVKRITMDLSSVFRAVAKSVFPKAKIIADKFHVVRIVIKSLDNVRKRIQKEFHAQKRKFYKRSRHILLSPNYKLDKDDIIILSQLLNASQELERAYVLKEEFYKIFKCKEREEAAKQLGAWLLLTAHFKLPEFEHCLKSFTDWSEEILNMVENTVSNGFIEGVNNKIKVLKRISFGVKNFERFRNRILCLCS